jgi:RHH-type transcriptional regulator, rel operon repressor / antitoxin RelB
MCYTCITGGLNMSTELVAVRLDEKLLERLNRLAKRTGRSKSFYIKQAIARFMEDMEDTFIAIDRLENVGRTYSMEEAKRLLDVED